MRIVFSLFLSLVLVGCGFHLRWVGEAGGLSFTQVQVQGDGVAARNLRDYLAHYKGVQLVEKGSAETVIRILDEQYSKDVFSVNNAGRVAEYRLNYRIRFSASHRGEPVLEEGSFAAMRMLSWNENSVLSKEAEEATLVRDMQRDILQPVLRRVSAAVRNAPQ